ncbi:hypothetical protein H0A61_02907 [Koleobacter methoxysyntrophicus]|uniref:Copper amine oxidase-like N-terminal domain-containing protein n=1 Tax=Koleobacter methoxysyntrophicus TaxID=2751313 RepID=A0A8A0RSM1_9FIRM|nr:stalk domain-containing protein [Koleobacter methoxysyntrophicus]QSQ10499.1 hypothetical protein H0A61_02907 [Koleobacter methoxysyntrophicus]
MKNFSLKLSIKVLIIILMFICLIGINIGVADNLKATISDIKLFLNDKKIDEEVLIIGNSSYLPIRAISEILGLEVEWNGKTRTINLKGNSNLVKENKELKSKILKLQTELKECQTKIEEYKEEISKLKSDLKEYKEKHDYTYKKTKEDENKLDDIKISGVDELLNFLKENYSELDTPTGAWKFEFDIEENDLSFFQYDYWIQVDWSGGSPHDLKYSIKISDKDKKKTIELLKEFQKEIAEIAFKALPGKKIMGGFYSGFYKYPSIKVGYESIRFLTWVNYNASLDGEYSDAKVTEFHWYDELDDYDF